MFKVTFSNGATVQFASQPSKQDIEDAHQHVLKMPAGFGRSLNPVAQGMQDVLNPIVNNPVFKGANKVGTAFLDTGSKAMGIPGKVLSESPVGQAVSNAVGVAGKVIGGTVGTAGSMLQGLPPGQQAAQNITRTANATGAFGKEIGKEGVAQLPAAIAIDALSTAKANLGKPKPVQTTPVQKKPLKIGLSTEAKTGLDPIADPKNYSNVDDFINAQKPIYHGTTKKFDNFDPELSPGGTAWFTDNRNALETGADVGLNRAKGESLNIMDRYIKPGLKLVDTSTKEGAKLADDMMQGQLEGMGYRGVIHEADPVRGRYVELFHPNQDAITKSQLTDIYNSVNPGGVGVSSTTIKKVNFPQEFQDLADEITANGGKINKDATVTLYHRTTPEGKALIEKTGIMKGKEDGLFFSTKPDGQISGYGSSVVEVKVPLKDLELDDVFGDEAHLRIPTKKPGASVKVNVVKTSRKLP